jgi:hypothetical protein
MAGDAYYDLIVALTGASSFNLVPASVQTTDLAGGEFKVIEWTMTSTSVGIFNVGVYEGNNEVIVPSKAVTVN